MRSSRGVRDDAVLLRVRLLGAVEVRYRGERLGAFDTPRLQKFLALLVLRPELAHRSRLAFELWPDSTESQARTNLRKLLHEFRNAIPDSEAFSEISADVVRWIPTDASAVDVVDFRAALGAGDLQAAAECYAGDLLPACYDDWILDERAKLRSEAHAAFVGLAESAAAGSDPSSTIRHARAALDLEPTDEAAIHMEIEAHLELGHRMAALRCYHRFAAVLEQELGVTPSESIEDLYRDLRSNVRPPGEIETSGQPKTAVSAVVGRAHELALLRDEWLRAQDTGARLVVVTGEPGVGKSKLAEELGRMVRSEGHAVAAARAYEAAGRLPWGPVVDLLRSDALRGSIETLDGVWRTEIARLLPELVETTEARPPDQPGDIAQRRRLFDAVNRSILGDDRPRLLIVDDLQWCDSETIELIGFVVRSGVSAPVLIVGTLRSEEVPPDHPVNSLLDALAREQAVTRVPLEPLDEPATATLASQLGAIDAADPAFAARLWAETEGNPLFVVEAIRAGLPDRGPGLLTPTMRAVLSSRLDQLSEEARELAEVAAVIGRAFSVELMAATTGVGEHELVERVDELWRRRIIHEHGRRYDFSHDKLRTVALEMVTPARRRRLHRAVADALAAEAGPDTDVVAAQLAAHYDQAGMVEPAIDAYRAAGERATAMSAFGEAVGMFDRALSLLAEVPASRRRDALELDIRIALGSPLVALEGYGSRSSHQLYERALSLCRRLDRPVEPPILRGLGLARLQGCRFDDAS
ncbi:MAG: AAA family ATPase, partial [Ilumatobacter sp.]|nr:AAA family ATPase [Ilumatobacter sp.]